jgi:hypothetical protein
MKRPLIAVLIAIAATGCQGSVHDILFGPSHTPEPATSQATAPVLVIPSPGSSPSPSPSPDAAPTCIPVPDQDIPCNDGAVAYVGASVYFIECDGQVVPGTSNATTIPLGCRLHMNTTPKDASGNPTRAQGSPTWWVDDPSLISFRDGSSYTPAWTTKAPGRLSIWSQIDGVTSNGGAPVTVTIQ